jgi:hypothetical protein
MANIDPLLERNRHFAATPAREGASIVSRYPVYVITCLDLRPRLRRHHRPGHHHHPGDAGARQRDSGVMADV